MNPQIVFCPFMTRERFSELVGVTPDTLERWVRDGRVPVFKMGKRSLVDLRFWITTADTTQGGTSRGLGPQRSEDRRQARVAHPVGNTGITSSTAK